MAPADGWRGLLEQAATTERLNPVDFKKRRQWCFLRRRSAFDAGEDSVIKGRMSGLGYRRPFGALERALEHGIEGRIGAGLLITTGKE
jgi:hypothetical protein